MEPTKYIWMNGEFVPWEKSQVHVLTHTLHYGAGAFEGIRAYKTERGSAVFRLQEHIDRLFYSAKAIELAIPFSPAEVIDATIALLKKNEVRECYIRPLVYFGYGKMGLNPAGAPPQIAIACWPWGAYLPHQMVDLMVSPYIRIHRDSTVADAKLCGHYVNSILAVLSLKGTQYHEALLLNDKGEIAEGPGENIFIVSDGTLQTPRPGCILPGITRDTVMALAKELSLPVRETDLRLEDLKRADEAFFVGTAAEVTPIRSVNDTVIGSGQIGPVTKTLKDLFQRVVRGQEERHLHYLTFVDEE